jgi:hypothetical protein
MDGATRGQNPVGQFIGINEAVARLAAAIFKAASKAAERA